MQNIISTRILRKAEKEKKTHPLNELTIRCVSTLLFCCKLLIKSAEICMGLSYFRCLSTSSVNIPLLCMVSVRKVINNMAKMKTIYSRNGKKWANLGNPSERLIFLNHFLSLLRDQFPINILNRV